MFPAGFDAFEPLLSEFWPAIAEEFEAVALDVGPLPASLG
jgi:hypothetical protein